MLQTQIETEHKETTVVSLGLSTQASIKHLNLQQNSDVTPHHI